MEIIISSARAALNLNWRALRHVSFLSLFVSFCFFGFSSRNTNVTDDKGKNSNLMIVKTCSPVKGMMQFYLKVLRLNFINVCPLK